MNIDYPSKEEIIAQKKIVLDAAFEKETLRRPGAKVVFSNCYTAAFISLLVYGLLLYFCYSIKGYGNEGYAVLGLYPMTWFSFYFLSILSEEQNGLIELKRSVKYSFMYLVSMRMLYTNIASVLLNLAMIGILYTDIPCFWNLAAAGTTADILLVLANLTIYERTNSIRLSAVILIGWLTGCVILMWYGRSLYHLLIEVIPLAVHLLIMLLSFLALLKFIRKVEYQNAYGF